MPKTTLLAATGLLIGTLLVCAAIQPQRLPGDSPALGAAVTQAATAEINHLIQQLGSEDFKQRDAAQDALVKLGRAAVPGLQAGVSDNDAERASRAKVALEQIKEARTSWGSVQNGLQAGLVIEEDKASWNIGEKFTVTYLVRNNSEQRTTIRYLKLHGDAERQAFTGLRLFDLAKQFAYLRVETRLGGRFIETMLSPGESAALNSWTITIWPAGLDRTPEVGTMVVEPGSHVLRYVDRTPEPHGGPERPIRSTAGLVTGDIALTVLAALSDSPLTAAVKQQPPSSYTPADIEVALSLMGQWMQLHLDAIDLGEGADQDQWAVARRTVDARCTKLSNGSVDFLGHIALARDEESRGIATQLLGFSGKARATAFLMKAIDDQSGVVRRTAAAAFEQFRTPEVRQKLLEVLQKDTLADVRASAGFALGHMGDQTVTPALIAALKTERDAHAQEAIFEALSWLKNPSVIPALKELQGQTTDPKLQQGITNIIRNIENPNFGGSVRQPASTQATSLGIQD